MRRRPRRATRSKGGGPETFEPHFTFFGFRYVAVDGYPGELAPDALTGVVVHSDMAPAGEFETSKPLVNQLQHNILWGQKGNFLDVPTDCPQRDERLGWTGDAQVFSRTAAFNMDVAGFFTKWLRDVAADQFEDGRVPHVVPNVLTRPDNPAAGSAGWADAAVIVPWNMYLAYGDRRILEEQYDSMARWVEYERKRAGDDFIWTGDFHFGDWLAYAAPSREARSYPGATTGKDLIATAFFAHSTDLLQRTALVLGKREDAARYAEQLARIKSAFRDEFVSGRGRVGENTQTAYVLALQFDLLPEELRPVAAKRLAEEIRERKHLTTGFLGTPYLCHVLSRYGYLDEAYLLLNRDEYPSWLYPVKQGATTIWERWDSQKPDGSFQDSSMNSFNHYAYGAIGEWMYRVMAGIETDESAPGYKHVLIQPRPGGGFTRSRPATRRCTEGWLRVDARGRPLRARRRGPGEHPRHGAAAGSEARKRDGRRKPARRRQRHQRPTAGRRRRRRRSGLGPVSVFSYLGGAMKAWDRPSRHSRPRRRARGASPALDSEITHAAERSAWKRASQNPPNEAKPRVWWHWMNGNITKEGIRLDLEWMKRVGIGGFQNFDASLFPDKVVDQRLVYMTPEWKEAFLYATTLADQLGLEEAIAGSPGWSESGGPWVTPAQAMKKLVWSETRVEGGRRFTGISPEASHDDGAVPERAAHEPARPVGGPGAEAGARALQRQQRHRVSGAGQRRADDRPAPGRHVEQRNHRSVAARRRGLRQVRRPPDGAGRPEGVDPVRLLQAGGDSRRVPRDRWVQVAVRPTAARPRPRGERRRPELQEGRQRPAQHGNAEHGVVCAGCGPLLQGGVRDPAAGAADGHRPPASSATDRAPGCRAGAAHRSARDPVRGEGGIRAARPASRTWGRRPSPG